MSGLDYAFSDKFQWVKYTCIWDNVRDAYDRRKYPDNMEFIEEKKNLTKI